MSHIIIECPDCGHPMDADTSQMHTTIKHCPECPCEFTFNEKLIVHGLEDTNPFSFDEIGLMDDDFEWD